MTLTLQCFIVLRYWTFRSTACTADHSITESRKCKSLHTSVHGYCQWQVLYADIFVIKRWVFNDL